MLINLFKKLRDHKENGGVSLENGKTVNSFIYYIVGHKFSKRHVQANLREVMWHYDNSSAPDALYSPDLGSCNYLLFIKVRELLPVFPVMRKC
jgi:hypothetical protein